MMKSGGNGGLATVLGMEQWDLFIIVDTNEEAIEICEKLKPRETNITISYAPHDQKQSFCVWVKPPLKKN